MFILEKEKCNIDTSDGHEKNCQVSLKAEKCCIHCVNTAYEYSLSLIGCKVLDMI